MSTRPSREQIDAQIVGRAAALFAQHRVSETSLPAVVQAVGYAKAGLLHHFPSKEALCTAVLATAEATTWRTRALVGDLRRPGTSRPSPRTPPHRGPFRSSASTGCRTTVTG